MPNISSYTFPQMTDLVKRSFQDWLENLPQDMRKSWLVVEDVLPLHTGEFKRFAERLQRNQYASVRDEGDVSKKAKVSQKATADILAATLETIQKTVSKGKKVTLVGFGTWEARKRAARTGRNPQTGKELKIAAKTVPAFSAGKKFKEVVNAK